MNVTQGGKWFSSCPDNAFQMVLKGQTPPALAQRVGALFKPMPQLFVVGFIAAAGGYAYTAASVALRKWLDPSSTGGASLPPDAIAKISVAIGAYVAVSTNWRYQVVAGVFEARMFDVLFAKQIALRSAGSTLVRTANTYLGSYWIVSYLRALDLQKIDG
ncbi:hypothetical protein GUITHDRAFT_107953 [Guillardia theta CCMP2712]|uniref:Uncharacterized protein n=1 Tax=Guillardia theta (strain CCMP2712) TaxID=905079 RepID=L1JDI9_GUITC|nr:hypothetical protein GUITHDRAFT_107953 [Guillardia theta CCMP2712]EKX46347.1 hypothetical protein GUITHDRAFT_107953 [Guillardia theta CCMP2712]|eukprot:XP_005833327.1 hypothetical protein GUITHDRAFT_107953 [Guillardia theta CCMP2712]